jgi:hypothetical protein
MNGMQAPQMPGQAAMPVQPQMMGIRQQPQGPKQDVPALVPQMQQMDPRQLAALVQQSRGKPDPKGYAALAALLSELKEQQYAQAAAGQNAMQQNARQPQGTVADQLLAAAQQMQRPPIQAAYGGLMRGYSGGGIVAFQAGGAAQTFSVAPPVESRRTYGFAPDYEDARRFGISLSPYDSPEVRAEKLQRLATMREFEKQAAGNRAEIPTEESEATRKLLETAYADRSRAKDIPPRAAAAPATRSPAPRPDTRAKPTTRPAPGIATAQPQLAPATYQPPMGPDIYDKLEADRIAELEKQRTLPEDVLSGRRGIETLVAEQLKAQREDMAARRKAAEEQRAKAMGAEGLGARDFFEIAGAIDPRRGYVMGSLGRGLAGVTARQAAEREAARKEFAQFERDERSERTLMNQMAVAEATRAQAIREGDMNRANALTEKLAGLRADFQKLREERQQRDYENFIKQETLGIQRHEAESKRMTAKAAQTAAAAKTADDTKEKRLAIQSMRADPNYAAIVKELTEAKKLAALSKSPMMQERLRAAQQAADDLARAYGVTPGMVGGAGAPAPTGGATDPLGIR